jgi:membrane protein implicated in regulation of membrane protease activity
VQRPGDSDVRGPRTGLAPLTLYLLKNVPELALAAVALWLMQRAGWLSGITAVTVFALLLLKDVVLYRYVAHALRTDRTPLIGPEHLIGQSAVVEEALEPSGIVRAKGERWRGEALGAPAPVGRRVRIVAVRGLTLLVSTEAE